MLHMHNIELSHLDQERNSVPAVQFADNLIQQEEIYTKYIIKVKTDLEIH